MGGNQQVEGGGGLRVVGGTEEGAYSASTSLHTKDDLADLVVQLINKSWIGRDSGIESEENDST